MLTYRVNSFWNHSNPRNKGQEIKYRKKLKEVQGVNGTIFFFAEERGKVYPMVCSINTQSLNFKKGGQKII